MIKITVDQRTKTKYITSVIGLEKFSIDIYLIIFFEILI